MLNGLINSAFRLSTLTLMMAILACPAPPAPREPGAAPPAVGGVGGGVTFIDPPPPGPVTPEPEPEPGPPDAGVTPPPPPQPGRPRPDSLPLQRGVCELCGFALAQQSMCERLPGAPGARRTGRPELPVGDCMHHL